MPQHKREREALLSCVGLLACLPLLYVGYLFVSVVFLGGSSECPQHLCL